MIEVQRPTKESQPLESSFENLPAEQQAEARFNFAVARAQSNDAAKSMIEKRPEVSFDSINRQKEPVYNRVLSESSMKERAKYWEPKGLTFEKAKEMWKKDFSTIISTDGNKSDVRKSAIRSILPKTNTELLERNTTGINITEADTETLFNEYSNNESDVDKFMKNALDDTTELDTLKARLPHLEWVAVGFFGENTAAKIRRQLLLEAETRGKSADEARKVFEGKDSKTDPEPVPVNSPDQRPNSQKTSGSGSTPTRQNQETAGSGEKRRKDDIKLPKNLNQVEYQITDEDANERGFNLIRTMNNDLDYEKLYTNKSQVYIATSPQILLNHIMSTFGKKAPEIEGMSIDPSGTIKFDHMKINIRGTVADVYNITISNDPLSPGRIKADFENAKKSGLTSFAAGDISKKVASELSAVNRKAMEMLKNQVTEGNKIWEPNRLFILEGSMVVGFKRSKAALQETA